MTLGEKIKTARKNAGLTQEQMAEKLMISRPAITKWESDKGIPDIENLKAISKLLDVSLDYLLNDGEDIDLNVIKEPIDLSKYGKGFKKKLKDKIIREKYPDAEIMTLLPAKILTKGEKVIDNLLGWLTSAPFGTPDLINSIKLVGNEYYLVISGDNQYLVIISNEFMETHRMNIKVDTSKGSKFVIGDMRYVNAGPIIYA